MNTDLKWKRRISQSQSFIHRSFEINEKTGIDIHVRDPHISPMAGGEKDTGQMIEERMGQKGRRAGQ